ncbi:hypothetical protein LX87_00212 [Larkinella arboricola]|uniref:Uncharacterized protein n=1 Tax=Larkinella arboricola TaxID=643671 RepID=A0A327X4Z2_LARAB|nr:hypothetical protein [Larkinella arboricola]RAK02097.1 hypothetical protein LX87_00212 [Larkinella arboricola]
MKRLILPILALSLGITAAFGQCNPPTPAQNAAYEKVVKELQNQFRNNPPAGDWQVFDERSSLGKLELSDEYGKIFRICGDRYDLTFLQTSAANRQKARADSAKAIGDTTTQQQHSLVMNTDSVYREADPNRATDLAKSTVDINVEMNAGNYRLEEPLSNRFVESYKTIAVNGAPLALQITLKPNESGIAARPETVVLLGNWKNNLQKNPKGDKLYHYSYKKGGTLIENLVVTIKAPFDVASEIVKQVDWKAISATLTK